MMGCYFYCSFYLELVEMVFVAVIAVGSFTDL